MVEHHPEVAYVDPSAAARALHKVIGLAIDRRGDLFLHGRSIGLDPMFRGSLMRSVFEQTVKSHHCRREQQAAPRSGHLSKRTHIGAQILRAS
jgi:hypothetical protein